MCLLAYLLLRHNISDKGGNSVSVVRRPQPVVAAVVLVLSTSFSLGQQHSSSCCTLDEKFVTYVVFDELVRRIYFRKRNSRDIETRQKEQSPRPGISFDGNIS